MILKTEMYNIYKTTNGMETALTNTCGLIGIYNSPTYAPTSYTTSAKHIVKKYTNAGHNVSDYQHPSFPTNTGPSEVQTDILNWLNGH